MPSACWLCAAACGRRHAPRGTRRQLVQLPAAGSAPTPVSMVVSHAVRPVLGGVSLQGAAELGVLGYEKMSCQIWQRAAVLFRVRAKSRA